MKNREDSWREGSWHAQLSTANQWRLKSEARTGPKSAPLLTLQYKKPLNVSLVLISGSGTAPEEFVLPACSSRHAVAVVCAKAWIGLVCHCSTAGASCITADAHPQLARLACHRTASAAATACSLARQTDHVLSTSKMFAVCCWSCPAVSVALPWFMLHKADVPGWHTMHATEGMASASKSYICSCTAPVTAATAKHPRLSQSACCWRRQVWPRVSFAHAGPAP